MSLSRIRQTCRQGQRIKSSAGSYDLMAFTHTGLFRVLPIFPRQLSLSRWRQVAPTVVTRHCCSANESQQTQILRQSSMDKVEKILMHRFKDRSLLAQALTHRSVVNSGSRDLAFYEDSDKELRLISQNNERLELLGDRVFGLLATEVLYEREDEMSEGQLTHTLQFILSRQKADKYFRSLGLDKYMLEATILKGGQGSRYGDCFEALLAALFLDGGFETASSFFRSRVVPNCEIFAGEYTDTNYKKKLQEYLVSQGLPSPALATQIRYIPDSNTHDSEKFAQAIILFGRKVSVGKGPTRVEADQDAAKRLLANLQNSQATCFLIRLARRANDQRSLEKLQSVRAAQVSADSSKASCSS